MSGHRARPRITWALAGGVLAGLLACAPSAPCGLRQCDIRQPDCQRDNVRATACLRGREPVDFPVTVKSQQAYIAEAEQEAAAVTEAEREHFRTWQRGLALLGLGDPGRDADAVGGGAGGLGGGLLRSRRQGGDGHRRGPAAGFAAGGHRAGARGDARSAGPDRGARGLSRPLPRRPGPDAGVQVGDRGRGQRDRRPGGAGPVRRQRRRRRLGFGVRLLAKLVPAARAAFADAGVPGLGALSLSLRHAVRAGGLPGPGAGRAGRGLRAAARQRRPDPGGLRRLAARWRCLERGDGRSGGAAGAGALDLLRRRSAGRLGVDGVLRSADQPGRRARRRPGADPRAHLAARRPVQHPARPAAGSCWPPGGCASIRRRWPPSW